MLECIGALVSICVFLNLSVLKRQRGSSGLHSLSPHGCSHVYRTGVWVCACGCVCMWLCVRAVVCFLEEPPPHTKMVSMPGSERMGLAKKGLPYDGQVGGVIGSEGG